jgi:hypothetical protein
VTRSSPLAALAGLLMSMVVAGCGGTSQPVDEPAAAQEQAQPGGPGGDSDGGADGTDVGAQGGNPGAPGDVAVFEEAGVPFSVLRDDADAKCAGGVCTLADPVVTAGDPSDLGGVEECLIAEQSDISYDPPAQDGLFQKGATVTALVDCTADDSGDSGNQGSGDGTGDPADESQG